MAREDNSDAVERRTIRHEARTALNHLLGYAGILRGDAEDSHLSELEQAYGEVVFSALTLKERAMPAFLPPEEGGLSEDRLAAMEQEAYGLLFDIVSRIQTARRLASGDGRFLPDTDKILASANRLIELFELNFHGSGPDDSIEGFRKRAVPTEEKRGGTAALARFDDGELGPASLTGRILVVDDDSLNRDILEHHLSRQGHEVKCAADGPEALAILRTELFDLLILDLLMPGMNGYQVLERIRGAPPAGDLRIIVISALHDTASIARCIQLGAEDYLPRDFEPVILRARIESCLEKRNLKRKEALWLAAATASTRRLQAELQEGAAYVRSLLPAPLASEGLHADWVYIPSLSLGGDAFGYHRIARASRAEGCGPGVSGDAVALFLIDVSGHGIQAALYSVTVMNLLKTQTLTGADFTDPASVLSRLNATFRMEEQNNLYFTAWYGVWEAGTRSLAWSSAGSPPAILVSPEGGGRQLVTEGMIVGVSEDAEYATHVTKPPPGSSLYLFSDGIFETALPEGGILGLDAFTRILVAGSQRHARRETEAFLPALVEEIRGLSAGKNFEDDVSLVEFHFD